MAEEKSANPKGYYDGSEGVGELGGLVFGIIVFGSLLGGAMLRSANNDTKLMLGKEITRDTLLSVLNDPAMTDQIIEQLKKPKTRELLADPEVIEKLRKLAIAIEGEEVTLHSKMEELERRKALLEEVTPKKNWGARAIEGASEKKAAERN